MLLSKNSAIVMWLMGPTSSGKSTIAEKLLEILEESDIPIIHFDGDEVRDFFGPDYGFSESNRGQVVETLAHLAGKSHKAGLNVVVSALTAHQSARDYIAGELDNLKIGYVTCPIETCIERDPKGLYAKAKNREIDTLIGYNSEYIPPADPNIVLDTEKFSAVDLANMLAEFIRNHTLP